VAAAAQGTSRGWAAEDGAGCAAQIVDELVALLSADINLCSLLTGLYLDVHAAR